MLGEHFQKLVCIIDSFPYWSCSKVDMCIHICFTRKHTGLGFLGEGEGPHHGRPYLVLLGGHIWSSCGAISFLVRGPYLVFLGGYTWSSWGAIPGLLGGLYLVFLGGYTWSSWGAIPGLLGGLYLVFLGGYTWSSWGAIPGLLGGHNYFLKLGDMS